MNDKRTAPAVIVESVDLAADVIDRGAALDTGIAVLPVKTADGKGIYSEPSVMLVKELRALGAEAEFAYPSEDRLFEVKKSAEALLIAYVIGVASTASWDLMKRLLRRRRTSRLFVTYLELEEGSDRRGAAWKVKGDSEGVVQAIDALRNGRSSDGQSDDGSG